METVSLDVQARDKSQKASNLLMSGVLPLEYYGNGVENRSFQVDYQTFRKLFRKTGQNTIIELNVGGKEKIKVLVHDIQYNPISGEFQHIDLINVRMDEELQTVVPVEFVGEAPAVKNLSGVLTPTLHEIEIRCLPNDLIHSIVVSLDSLENFGSAVRVSDLVVPKSVKIVNDPEEMVVTVIAPRIEDEAVVSGEASDNDSAAGAGADGKKPADDKGGE